MCTIIHFSNYYFSKISIGPSKIKFNLSGNKNYERMRLKILAARRVGEGGCLVKLICLQALKQPCFETFIIKCTEKKNKLPLDSQYIILAVVHLECYVSGDPYGIFTLHWTRTRNGTKHRTWINGF